MSKYNHEACHAEFLDLVDMSISEDRTVAYFCASAEEYAMMRSILLCESDDDCDLEPVGGEGYSGPEANGGVMGWGYRADDTIDMWRIEVYDA